MYSLALYIAYFFYILVNVASNIRKYHIYTQLITFISLYRFLIYKFNTLFRFVILKHDFTFY